MLELSKPYFINQLNDKLPTIQVYPQEMRLDAWQRCWLKIEFE